MWHHNGTRWGGRNPLAFCCTRLHPTLEHCCAILVQLRYRTSARLPYRSIQCSSTTVPAPLRRQNRSAAVLLDRQRPWRWQKTVCAHAHTSLLGGWSVPCPTSLAPLLRWNCSGTAGPLAISLAVPCAVLVQCLCNIVFQINNCDILVDSLPNLASAESGYISTISTAY